MRNVMVFNGIAVTMEIMEMEKIMLQSILKAVVIVMSMVMHGNCVDQLDKCTKKNSLIS